MNNSNKAIIAIALAIFVSTLLATYSGLYVKNKEGAWVIETTEGVVSTETESKFFWPWAGVQSARFVPYERKIEGETIGTTKDGIPIVVKLTATITVPVNATEVLSGQTDVHLAALTDLIEAQFSKLIKENSLRNLDDYIVNKCLFGTCYDAISYDSEGIKIELSALKAKWDGAVTVKGLSADYRFQDTK